MKSPEERMTDPEVRELIAAVCNGVASVSETLRLEKLLADDEEVQMLYLLFAGVHAQCLWKYQGKTKEVASLAAASCQSPSGVPALAMPVWSLAGYLSPSWLVAYLVAMVITAAGLLICAHTYISRPEQISGASPTERVMASASAERPSSSAVVGRITGMVDCQWAGSGIRVQGAGARVQGSGGDSQKILKSLVSLGDRFSIASGLLEITYDTGAKVILQGPVTYEVESTAGGYLAVGKLTARLDHKATHAGTQISKSQIPNLKSQTFAVRTPTAVVTDLGTEFGVEVPERGGTVVYVMEGKVDCQSISQSGTRSEASHLVAGQTAKIVSGGVAIEPEVAPKPDFVRVIARPTASAEVPRSQVLAYWRFEEAVPPPKNTAVVDKNNGIVQENVIRDYSGHGNHLHYNSCNVSWELGIGQYPVAGDAPPLSMFQPGYSGGTKSFNSGAIDPQKDGVLFHNAYQHGNVFDFQDKFTIEGFFKTSGDQSAAGIMAIVYKGCWEPAYLISLNRESPGAIQFTLFNKAKKAVSATVTDENFADGQWHYFAARLDTKGRRSMSLMVGGQDGRTNRQTTKLPEAFTINWPDDNLLIGRLVHRPAGSIVGHFRGAIDEIRICRDALRDEQLLFAPTGRMDTGQPNGKQP